MKEYKKWIHGYFDAKETLYQFVAIYDEHLLELLKSGTIKVSDDLVIFDKGGKKNV